MIHHFTEKLTSRDTSHALQLFRAPYDLYASARRYFGDSQAPYMLHVAGEQIVVVTDAKQMTAILDDNIRYTYEDLIDLVYRHVGKVSDGAHAILWRTPEQGFESLHPNPRGLVLVHTGRELLHKQLLTKEPFEMLVKQVLGYVEQGNQWANLTGPSVLAANETTKVVSLHHWVRDVMVNDQAHAFFGPQLYELMPEYTEIFDQWDKNSWMITYQYPDFLAKPAVEAREKLVKVCKAFLDLPQDRRQGNVAFVQELVAEMQHAGLGTEDCARILMIIMWAINSNVQLATFWMMNHILKDARLHTALIEEIEPIMPTLDAVDLSDPQALRNVCRTKLVEGCPLLNATFDEVVRLCSTGMAVRKTTKQVHIDGKAIPGNVKIFMPQRQLLLDKDVFGPETDEFNPDRFLQNKSLLRHDHYRPFGGGITYCSGKAVARFEMLAFVAWSLCRFKLRVVQPGEELLGVTGTPFPRLDLKRPSLGISKQVERDNLVVEITQRVR